jgi:hypothetical protein
LSLCLDYWSNHLLYKQGYCGLLRHNDKTLSSGSFDAEIN